MCSSGALMFKVRDTDAGWFAYARGSRETEKCALMVQIIMFLVIIRDIWLKSSMIKLQIEVSTK